MKQTRALLTVPSKWEKPSVQRLSALGTEPWWANMPQFPTRWGTHLPQKSNTSPLSARLTYPGEGGGLSACWPPSPCWLSAPGSSKGRQGGPCDPRLQRTGAKPLSPTWQMGKEAATTARHCSAPLSPVILASTGSKRELAHGEQRGGGAGGTGHYPTLYPVIFPTQHWTQVRLGADSSPEIAAGKSQRGMWAKLACLDVQLL